MSKLEELIKELCPNGVEYKKIGEIAQYEQPTKYIVKSTDYSNDFKTPVLTAGQSFILGYTDETEGIYYATKENPVIIFDDFTGAFKWVDFPFKVKSSAMKMITADNKITTLRYLFHLMGFLNYTSDEHKRLWISLYSEFFVPVPPLPVQREIVRILDSFTELTAELTARKKQYEYYRDALLSFADKSQIQSVKLSDIATDIYRGCGIKRDEVTDTGIPCVRYGEIYTKYGVWFDQCDSHTQLEKVKTPKYFEYGDILFAITGESVEDIAKSTAYVGHEKCLAGGDIVVLKHNQNPKYLAYVLSTNMARQQKSKGKIKSKVVHSSVPSIANIEIPLPPLDVQERLVNVLDNFDAICSDLNIGLPAEIEARQKQYEYYRDLLLSFDNSQFVNVERERERERERVGISRNSEIALLQYVFGYVYMTLDKISVNCDRLRKPVTKSNRTSGRYPYYGASGIVDYVESYIFDGDYLLVSEDGANLLARSTPIAFSVSGKSWVNNHAHVLKFDSYELRRYVEIYLNSIDLSKYISGGAQPKLNQDNLNKIPIPIPNTEQIKHVIAILDRFDALCNDISEGLPAEIEARQKQYEYYRDKLLNFM